MDDAARREIYSLSAETLALQAVLAQLIAAIRRSGSIPETVLAEGFDTAINTLEVMTISHGNKAAPEHLARSIEIAEQLRHIALGHKKPSGVV